MRLGSRQGLTTCPSASYLVHPLLLLGLLGLPRASAPPAAVTAGLATVLALAGSLLVAEVARRTPAQPAPDRPAPPAPAACGHRRGRARTPPEGLT